MGENKTVVSAITLYRHLQQYCSHPSIYWEEQGPLQFISHYSLKSRLLYNLKQPQTFERCCEEMGLYTPR